MKQPHLRLIGWVAAVWIPAAVMSLIVGFQAAATSNIVAQMAPGLESGTIAGAMPWWVLGGIIAAVVLVAVVVLSLLLQSRPWLALLASAGTAGIILVSVFYSLVVAPVGSVLGGGL